MARFDAERGAHPVEVAPFSISIGAVTNAQYEQFVQAEGAPTHCFVRHCFDDDDDD